MTSFRSISVVLSVIALVWSASAQYSRAQSSDDRTPGISGSTTPKLDLTPAQRNAIYRAVSQDKSKIAKQQFPAVVGAEVPPMIELYALPDDAVAGNASAKFYQYTMVQNVVVLVDPTKMLVIATIGPQ
jgi:Protein of unknown function (DUF1236)